MQFSRWVAQGLQFFDTNFHILGPTETLLWGLQMKLHCLKAAKNAYFRPVNRYNSEVVEDRHIVTMEY